MGNFKFLTTIDYSDHKEFAERSFVLPPHDGTLMSQLIYLRKLLSASKENKVFLLDSASGSIHPDLLAAALIGFMQKKQRPLIVMMGDMWHKDRGIQGVLQKLLLRLADRSIFRYAPLSLDEFPIFAKAWGISQKKLRFLPYFYTFTSEDLSDNPPEPEDFIFSGGNSHRDYESLIKVATELPNEKFIIASHRLSGIELPKNVLAGQVPRDEFIRLMWASKMVVVPIQQGLTRSTGHQTYLNGLLLGKPTIVNNVLGVKDHLRHMETAIVVNGSPKSYVDAIKWVLDLHNSDLVRNIAYNGQKTVLRDFSFEKHCECLLSILEEAYIDYF